MDFLITDFVKLLQLKEKNEYNADDSDIGAAYSNNIIVLSSIATLTTRYLTAKFPNVIRRCSLYMYLTRTPA